MTAFPVLLWICALNRGGEVWGDNLPGTIGVGTDSHHRMGAMYCISIEQQIQLRALYLSDNPKFQFTSVVDSLATFNEHQKTKAVVRAHAAAPPLSQPLRLRLPLSFGVELQRANVGRGLGIKVLGLGFAPRS